VTLQKMTVRKPLKTCRKRRKDVRTGRKSLTRDKSRRDLYRCLVGIRHKDGMSCKEASSRNLGTCAVVLRERANQQTC
jgi:hypothetical protein